MEEIFVPLEFDGYLISNYGRVFSDKTNQFLKPWKHPSGDAYYFNIYHQRKDKHINIGRAVLSHFDRISFKDEVAGHLNLIYTENTIDNLDWFNRGDWNRYKKNYKRGVYRYSNKVWNLKKPKYRAIFCRKGQVITLGYWNKKRDAQIAYYSTFTRVYGYAPWGR